MWHGIPNGETGQWFDSRTQQHQTAIKNLDMKNVILACIKQTGHLIKWGEAKYIDQHNYANRKMKEAIHMTVIYMYIFMHMLQVKAIQKFNEQ